MSLRMQLLLLQVTIVLATVVGTGLVAALLQEQQLRESYEDRMVAVAQSVASLPVIIEAFDDRTPSRTIQPIAEVIREASDVTYVVVANDEGIRYSHPDPERIGERVSTDPRCRCPVASSSAPRPARSASPGGSRCRSSPRTARP